MNEYQMESGDLPKELPPRVAARLAGIRAEHAAVVDAASAVLNPLAIGQFSLRLRVTQPLPFPSAAMSAQALGFAIRFDELPADFRLAVARADDKWYIANLDEVRHILNDFRPLMFNQSDAVHFSKVHSAWFPLMAGTALVGELSASDAAGNDCTQALRKWIAAHRQVLQETVAKFDFDYMCNGVLQHSDARHANRFFEDYTSGELNYVYWRHVSALRLVHHLLRPYRFLVGVVSFPRKGAL